MTNEEIGDIYAKPQKNYISFNEALNLARQDEREKMQTEIGHLEYKIEGLQQALSRNKDEREKMTEQKVKDYFAGLNGKDTALVVLNYLLRGGITDDDLRGLRLQWIKEQPQGVDLSKMSEILRSNSKETWIAAKGSDEGWNTWWKKRNQLNTN